MSWREYEHRSNTDVEIAACYSEIERLQERIKELERKQARDNELLELSRRLANGEFEHKADTQSEG